MPFTPRTLELENGESWMHFRLRLAQFVEQVAQTHPDQCVYVVAHHGVIAAIFDNMFNVGRACFASPRFKLGYVDNLEFGHEKMRRCEPLCPILIVHPPLNLRNRAASGEPRPK